MPVIPALWKAEAGGFQSSRTARAIQRNSVSKKTNPKKRKETLCLEEETGMEEWTSLGWKRGVYQWEELLGKRGV